MLPDWIELCALFSAHRVEFLLAGGQAVIAHGYPRLTKDMDLWIRPTRENGERVLAALTEFGTPLSGGRQDRADGAKAPVTARRALDPRLVSMDHEPQGGQSAKSSPGA